MKCPHCTSTTFRYKPAPVGVSLNYQALFVVCAGCSSVIAAIPATDHSQEIMSIRHEIAKLQKSVQEIQSRVR